MKLLKGGSIAKAIRKDIKSKIIEHRSKGVVPTLGVLIAGDDPAVEVYTGMIERNCTRVGAEFKLYRFDKDISTEELVGKVVIVVANLEPKKMAGVESNAMLLAADVEDKPFWLTVNEDVPLGSPIK